MPTPGLSNPDAQLSTLEELRDLWNDHVVRGGTALAGEVLMQKERVIGVPDFAASTKTIREFRLNRKKLPCSWTCCEKPLMKLRLNGRKSTQPILNMQG